MDPLDGWCSDYICSKDVNVKMSSSGSELGQNVVVVRVSTYLVSREAFYERSKCMSFDMMFCETSKGTRMLSFIWCGKVTGIAGQERDARGDLVDI